MTTTISPLQGSAAPTPPAPPASFTRRNFGRSHAYYLDGRKIPGVTTILREGVPAPGLIGWAARTVAEYVADHLEDLRNLEGRNAIVGMLSQVPNDQRDSAGVRGTDVHRLAQLLHGGDEVEVPDHLAGHVDAYIRFLDEWKPTNELLERPILNARWRYGGTLDMIARLADGQTWIIDWKTGKSGVFAEAALQLAAYRHAEWLLDGERLVPMPKVDAAGVVWITHDSYEFRPVTAGEDQFQTFLYAKQVAAFAGKDGTGRSLIGAALEPGLPL